MNMKITVAAIGALLASACGGQSASVADIFVSLDEGSPPPDTLAVADSLAPPRDTSAPAPDSGPLPTDTVASPDTSPPPLPGAFGAPCDGNAQCDDGWCVPAPQGLVCSKSCLETCPAGWRCVGVSRPSEGVQFICLNTTGVLCHPCRDNRDCNFGVPSVPDLCVSYGDEGSFCGLACQRDGDCPGGYRCSDATTAGGQQARQCVAEGGVCECNGSARALELSTECGVINPFGTCPGERSCGPEGLSACGGEAASLERCNGRDDDCDGAVDEGIPEESCQIDSAFGSCPGQTRCVEAETVCVGRTPSVEACNGIDDDCDGDTDEGFVDTDEDGVADCVDPDDDGDLTIDGQDCAPLDPAIHPAAIEACNGLDDDCDGATDEEGATGCGAFAQDLDHDGYGSAAAGSRCLCGADVEGGWVIAGDQGDDCDDLRAATHPGAVEVCNGLDDNCVGGVDEGVSAPCGGCATVCLFDAGGDDGEALDAESEGARNLTEAPGGGLTLTRSSADIPFIWIANSGEDTVSKLDTTTGAEVARYRICSNPSRTAVDLVGDGIVSCRDDGRVAKVAILEADCVDRNGNGVIDTSRDLNADGHISADERVEDDECVLWVVAPDGVSGSCEQDVYSFGCARAAGVDKDNNVWVGMWNSQRLYQLEPSTGATIKTIQLTVRPYGLAIAGDQTIWIASRAPHALAKVDPVEGQVGEWGIPGSREAYGLALDHLNRIWVATGSHMGLSRFDPADESWRHFGPWSSRGKARGVAVKLLQDEAGQVIGSRVYVAHHTWGNCSSNGTHRKITVFDAGTQAELPAFDLGADYGPVGVAIDVAGDLWTVNQCGSNATKLDAETGQHLGTYAVGSSPYTYSDMTGYALRTITSPSGAYRQVFHGWQVGETRWRALFVDATLPGHGATYIRLRYRVAASDAELQAESWTEYFGGFPPEALPLQIDAVGFVIEVEVTLHTDNGDLLPVLHSISAIAEEH